MPNGRMTAWRLAIAAATALSAVPLLAVPAHALPSGGTVTGGGVTIGQPSGGNLVINQTTNRGAIDWQSFSIGQGESVRFNQPGASSISFNRVTGPDPSKIMGNLSSNGQVWLMNPNGVLFGANARVDTSGLVASTAGMTPGSFMAGNREFSVSGRSDATIVNEGRITVRDGGLAAFVAPGVRNSGVIEARVGKVALASGDRYTLDLYGDGLVKLAVDDKVATGLTGGDGRKLTARVENSGTIKADGGSVLLTTTAAAQVVDSLINVSGTIQARAATVEGGRIVLQGNGGTVNVSGTLDATGNGKGQTGGTVHVSGERIALASTAQVDVSGSASGGAALIGGDVKGTGALPTAKRTVVATGATIKADAGKKGKGGKVIVWSDEDTRFGGTISANGGAKGGDGGFAEVSGKSLQYAGSVSLAAPAGKVGTLLLDPANIRIAANPADSGGRGTNSRVRVKDTDINRDAEAGETRLYANDLQDKNVVLAATNDVSIDAPISTGNLSVTAGNDINVNAEVSSAALTLQAGNDISLNAAVVTSGVTRLTAGRDIGFNASLTTFAPTTLRAGRDVRIDSGLDVTAPGGTALSVSAGGFVTGDGVVHVRGNTRFDAQRIALSGGTASGGMGNSFEGVLNLNTTSRALLWNATDTRLGEVEVGGDLVLRQTGGSVTQTQRADQRGITVEGLLDISTFAPGSGVTLMARNALGHVSVATAGDLALTSSRALTLHTLDIGGSMALSAGGTGITQIGYDPVTASDAHVKVSGDTEFRGRSTAISLTNPTNSFGGLVTLSAGLPAEITAAGDLRVTGNVPMLTANAGGTVILTDVSVGTLMTDAGAGVTQSGALTVDHAATIKSGGTIDLTHAGNRFGSLNTDVLTVAAPTVVLGGTVVGAAVIAPAGSVVLARLSVETAPGGTPLSGNAGSLTINANRVDQTGPLTVEGETSISAASVHLNNDDNNFVGVVSATANGPRQPPFGVQAGDFTFADKNNLTFASVTASRLSLLGNAGRTVTFRGPIEVSKGVVDVTGFSRVSLNGGHIGQATGDVLASQNDARGELFIGGQRFTGAFVFRTNPLAELNVATGLLAAFAATSNDDFVRRLGRGEVSQTPAESAIEYRPEYEGFASNPFTPRYDLLGFDRGDPRAASFARNTPYVLDGFWEGLLR